MNFSKLLQDENTADWIKEAVSELAPFPYLADAIILVLAIAIGSCVAYGIFFTLRRVLTRYYRRHCAMSPAIQGCIGNMAFSLASCIPIYTVAYCIWVDGVHEWVALGARALMEGLFVLAVAWALTYAVRSFGLWYKQQRNSSQRPIDGLLNVAVAFVWAGAVIIIFSVMLDKSPFYLLSGLGAAAAVLMLVFQQAILSVAASVQVNADNLVQIGDWIAMEAERIDGVVEEITLHTVKVRNWDMTLVCVPVCDLVHKPFVNYTAMEKSGGRRIKRALLIDQRSIRFLTKDEVKTLKGFDILKNYLNGKEEQITSYNTGRTRFNTLHLSNIGTFRKYAQHYLEHNPHIRNDMPLVVRELAPTSSGIPLEIYCFSREVSWVSYEQVQSEIIEHLLAVLPSFRLRVFQQCSDIYQAIGEQTDVVGGSFRFDKLEDPAYSVRSVSASHAARNAVPASENAAHA